MRLPLLVCQTPRNSGLVTRGIFDNSTISGMPVSSLLERFHLEGHIMKRINKVAILGAGTMGARIAAHFANAGVPSYLLDIVPPDADAPARNKIAAAGLDAAKKSKPAAFMDASLARLVTVGNFDDDLKKLADVDWIIEAVVENLEIKRTLLRKVEAIRKPGTIVTTNTSGLPVGKIAEGFSRRLPAGVVWHALFQSSAVYAAAGD